MPFANPIIGGGGSLVYPSIHSPNFVTGVSGWTIRKNGSVEFNNGTFRGTVTAGAIVGGTVTGATISGGTISGTSITGGTITGATFDGTNFIFNASGQFFYSGTPATGNLILSIASVAGTDAFSNPYKAGFATYDNSLGNIAQINTGVLSFNQVGLADGLKSLIVDQGGTGVWDGSLSTALDTGASWGMNSKLTSGDGLNPEIVFNSRLLAATNGINAPNPSSTKVRDTWHDTGAMANSWGKGSGFFKYKMLPINGGSAVWVVAQGLVPGTVADGTTILSAANGLPAAYQPNTNKAMVADTNQIKVNAVGTGAFENARFNFVTDGSVTCNGFGSAATFANCQGIFPIDI